MSANIDSSGSISCQRMNGSSHVRTPSGIEMAIGSSSRKIEAWLAVDRRKLSAEYGATINLLENGVDLPGFGHIWIGL